MPEASRGWTSILPAPATGQACNDDDDDDIDDAVVRWHDDETVHVIRPVLMGYDMA